MIYLSLSALIYICSMCTQLIENIKKYVSLSDEDEALIINNVSTVQFTKKQLLLSPGKVCRANYFINKGCLRMYFINRKDSEHITQFGIENWWLTDYASLDTQQPSRFYIQAVENTEVIKLDAQVQAELSKTIPQLETYFRIILQKAYAASQRRLEYIFGMTDEERYLFFTKSYPAFVQRVPQYMLASYLGFTPQFLSKIRAKR